MDFGFICGSLGFLLCEFVWIADYLFGCIACLVLFSVGAALVCWCADLLFWFDFGIVVYCVCIALINSVVVRYGSLDTLIVCIVA